MKGVVIIFLYYILHVLIFIFMNFHILFLHALLQARVKMKTKKIESMYVK